MDLRNGHLGCRRHQTRAHTTRQPQPSKRKKTKCVRRITNRLRKTVSNVYRPAIYNKAELCDDENGSVLTRDLSARKRNKSDICWVDRRNEIVLSAKSRADLDFLNFSEISVNMYFQFKVFMNHNMVFEIAFL